jgi:hypothetical protein
MKSVALIASLFTVTFGVTANTTDELKFAFQLTRHGARAPSDGAEGFKVAKGMLTA